MNDLPTGGADRTMFAVINYVDSDAWGGVAYGNGANNEAFGMVVKDGTGELVLQGWGGGNDLVSEDPGIGAGWMVQSGVLAADAARLFKDGSPIDSWTHTYGTVLERLVIGEEIAEIGFVSFDVAAVLVYDRALSEGERIQVEEYLQAKYLETP